MIEPLDFSVWRLLARGLELFAESTEDSTAESTFLGATPVDDDGAWQLTLSDEKALLDGRYSISAQELNADGETLDYEELLILWWMVWLLNSPQPRLHQPR